MRDITAADVKDLRERTGMGLLEAKRHLTLQAMKRTVENGCTHTELRQIVFKLIEMMEGKL